MARRLSKRLGSQIQVVVADRLRPDNRLCVEPIFRGKKLGLAQKICPQDKSYSSDAFTLSIRSEKA